MNYKLIMNSRVNKDGTSILYLQTFFHGKKSLLPININIEKIYFDAKKERIKKIHPRADDYNLIIDKAKANITDIKIKAKLANVELTPKYIKNEFENPSIMREFYPWAIVEVERDNLSKGSHNAYIAIMNKFNEFAPGVYFADINDILIKEFDKWMAKNKKNSVDTRANAHKRIKQYCAVAVDRKMMSKSPYDRYKIKKSNKLNKKVYLTIEERKRLMDLYEGGDISDTQRKVLRGFLFGCFTGLRHSDIISVRKSNIMGDVLFVSMVKSKRTSGNIVKVPLVEYARKLIDDADIKTYGAIFKHVSEPKTNEHLKSIAAKAHIKKHITTHIARHTFATLFWEKTKDLASLQKLLGHSSITDTMIYAHVSDQIVMEQMKVFEL